MIQTQENGKKPHFRPCIGPLTDTQATKKNFLKIWLCQSLDIMVSYHHLQDQKKLMIQS